MVPSVTHALYSLERNAVFPDWYGNPSHVGPSPFDYSLPPEWKTPTSWLVLVDRYTPGELDEAAQLTSCSYPGYLDSHGGDLWAGSLSQCQSYLPR